MEAYSPHPRFVFHCNPGCSNAARQVAVNITTTIHRCTVSSGSVKIRLIPSPIASIFAR